MGENQAPPPRGKGRPALEPGTPGLVILNLKVPQKMRDQLTVRAKVKGFKSVSALLRTLIAAELNSR